MAFHMDIPSFQELATLWDPDVFDDMCNLWWQQLLEKNHNTVADLSNSPMIPFLTIQPTVVELIFSIAKILGQPPACRYLAVELFDIFLKKHFKELHSQIWSKGKQRIDPYTRWPQLLSRIKTQILLRVMSCIQIASKSVSNAQTLCPVTISTCLNKMKHNYSQQSVINSEQRVFRTLEFKIPLSTILDYVEYLIQALKGTVNNCDEIYDASLSVLDIVFISHGQIYKQLLQMLTKSWMATKKERKLLLHIECDTMFLASGVVTTAATLREGSNMGVLETLSAITKWSVQDIEGLAAIITEIILT